MEKGDTLERIVSLLKSTDKELNSLGKTLVRNISLRDFRTIDKIKIYLLFKNDFGRHMCKKYLDSLEKKIKYFIELKDFYLENQKCIEPSHFIMIQGIFIKTKKCRNYFLDDIPTKTIERLWEGPRAAIFLKTE